MAPKMAVGIIVICLAIGGGLVLSALFRPPAEAYEIMYNFKAGESYAYRQVTTVQMPMGGKMSFTTDYVMDVLDVADDEIVIRTTFTMQMAELPSTQMVVKERMTRRGEIISFEVESVKPPELMENIKKEIGGWQRLMENAYRYPDVPMPIGREWEVPLGFDFEIQPGVAFKLEGKARSSIDGKENLIVGAGPFECWRLLLKMNLSGQTSVGGQTVEMTLAAEGNMWVDQRTGAQVKINMPMEMEMKIADTGMETFITITSELVEYRAAP